MNARRIALVSVAALVAAAAAVTPIACGGAAGGIGIGIATLGISAILPGSSPGWRVVDTRFTTPSGAPPAALVNGGLPGVGGASPLTTTASPSDPIVLSPGEEIDRVIVAGGRILDRITVQARASASGGASSLRGTLLHTSWANGGGDRTTLATGSVAVASTAGPVSIVLDFTSFQAGAATFGGLHSDPGDIFVVRLENTGSNDVTIDPEQTRIDWTSAQVRLSELTFAPTRGGFGITGEQRRSLVSNTGTAHTLESLKPFVETGVNQVAVVRVLVKDIDANPLPGASVAVEATGSTTPTLQITSGADGIASSALTWTTAGAFVVTFTAAGAVAPELVDVDVSPLPVREFDGLVSFVVSSQALGTDVDVDCVHALDAGESDFRTTPGETTFPDQMVYELARDSSGGLEWTFDIAARTVSFAPTATATFVVRVLDATGALVAESAQMTATVGLQRLKGTMTQSQPLLLVGQGSGGASGGTLSFTVEIQSLASSDPARPGIEVVTDTTVGSAIYVPGPVIYAARAGESVLVSSPDPRR